MEQLQKLLKGSNSPMKLEQLFVQGQMASDGAVAAFVGRLEGLLREMVPTLSPAQLKEQMQNCTTTEQKAQLFNTKCRQCFYSTALSLYGVAVLAIAVKTCYAVAAAMMVEASPVQVAQDAEEAMGRI